MFEAEEETAGKGSSVLSRPSVTRSTPSIPWVATLDVVVKLTLLILVGLVLVDPGWGNLEGKAPTARALTYPLWSFLVPVVWAVRMTRGVLAPYPWLADLMVSLTCFTDVLGNRLDLYDAITWFDDWMHFANNALLGAAMIVLTLPLTASFIDRLQRSIAIVMTAALIWELWEYASFLTRSAEYPTAYADTLLDLALGWLGAAVGAVLCHLCRPRPGTICPPSPAPCP